MTGRRPSKDRRGLRLVGGTDTDAANGAARPPGPDGPSTDLAGSAGGGGAGRQWARGLLDTLEMRRVRTPFDAEMAASLVASLWRLAPGDDPDTAAAAAEGMVDELAALRRTDAVVLLAALGAVAAEPIASRARQAASAMAAAGVRTPRWLAEVGRAEVTAAWRMHHVLGDGDTIVLGCRHPGGQQHSLVVYIDHNLGTLVKDAFAAGPADEVLAAFVEVSADDPDVAVDELDLAEAAARVEQALQLTDGLVPPLETDDYPHVRPVLDARLAAMPAGGQVPQVPPPSAADRRALVEAFLASEDGEHWADDADAAAIAEQLVHFRCDHGDGQPLRWSAPLVELVLTDWFPRTVVAGPDLYAKVPDVLADWVVFAAERTELRDGLVDETLRAVDVFADEFDELVGLDDDRVAPPPLTAQQGHELLTALQALGAGPRPDIDPDARVQLRPVDWPSVPAGLRDRVEQIVAICDDACAAVLDAEYQELARRLVVRLARVDPSPLHRGRVEIWAGGVLYALGQLNYLFSTRASLHRTGDELAQAVGAKTGTIVAKATVVREAADAERFDPELTRLELQRMGPALTRMMLRY